MTGYKKPKNIQPKKTCCRGIIHIGSPITPSPVIGGPTLGGQFWDDSSVWDDITIF